MDGTNYIINKVKEFINFINQLPKNKYKEN